jgi:two-component system chemotaxis response regulator CheB
MLVAPPDHHLLVRAGKVGVERGPKENGFRPAVDPLFRSAAYTYGPEVVGVILSGALDDGTLGLQAIKEMGGAAIVQDPADALLKGMPSSAIRNVPVDQVLPAEAIGPAIAQMVERAPLAKRIPMAGKRKPTIVSLSSQGNLQAVRAAAGPPSVFTSPDCGGSL